MAVKTKAYLLLLISLPTMTPIEICLLRYRQNTLQINKKEIPNLVILPQGYDKGTKYPVLYRLHEELSYRHIKHDFISRQGIHSNAYWRNSIVYHLLYFHDFFEGRHVYKYHVSRYYNEM